MKRTSSRKPNSDLKIYRSFNRPQVSRKQQAMPKKNEAGLPKVVIDKRLARKVLVAFIVLMLGWFSYIRTVSVAGQPKLDKVYAEGVQSAAQSYLQARPWNRFQLFISSRDMASAIKKSVPTVSDVIIDRSLFSNKVALIVALKKPAALWQQGRGGPVYILDEQGRAFMRANGTEKLRKIVSLQPTQKNPIEGKVVVDAPTVKTLIGWQTELSKRQLTLEEMSISATPRLAELTIAGFSFKVRVATDVPAGEGVKALMDSLAKIKSKSVTVNQYVDVRIPYRVFYQ